MPKRINRDSESIVSIASHYPIIVHFLIVVLVLMIISNTFKVFSRTAAQTTGTTLEASANPYRCIASNISVFPSLTLKEQSGVLLILKKYCGYVLSNIT
jgi:uncharacterized membrane protein